MPSTNGHGPKWAILYCRVSTDEQARSGYSLAQQVEALREYAACEGYEVLEEVADPGHSGASLERPGMDRVRDLVAAGGVSVVLAQDRDRFSREPAYTYLLRREFEVHGCELRALNDRGDGSPEGELTDGILDQLAKFERAKIAERTRRGMLRKVREGRLIGTHHPRFGFRYNEARDGLIVYEPEMVVVEKIYRLAAEGLGVWAIQTRLRSEAVPSPRGARTWRRAVLLRMLTSPIYEPHSYPEIAERVAPEVAARLDPDKEYGLYVWNRKKTSTQTISEPDGNGGRRYRQQTTYTIRPEEEWVCIPVPTYLPRPLVKQARAMMAANKGTERKRQARSWELRGVLRCSCGSGMATFSAQPKGGYIYHYYTCRKRKECGPGSCSQGGIRAERAEEPIWRFVSELLSDPERIRSGRQRLIEQEKATHKGDPEKEIAVWAEKVAECGRLRSAYQDQQAAGLMTLEELGSKLTELEDTRKVAQHELERLRTRQERIAELQEDSDILLESFAGMVPEALEELSGTDRNKLYKMLRLEAKPTAEGGFDVSGAFRSSEPIGTRRAGEEALEILAMQGPSVT
jgi:site-specific DNA recombinase